MTGSDLPIQTSTRFPHPDGRAGIPQQPPSHQAAPASAIAPSSAPPGTPPAIPVPLPSGSRATLRARRAPARSGRAAPPRPVSHPARERVAGGGAARGRGRPEPLTEAGGGRGGCPRRRSAAGGARGHFAGRGRPAGPSLAAPGPQAPHCAAPIGGGRGRGLAISLGFAPIHREGDGDGGELALPIGRDTRGEAGPGAQGRSRCHWSAPRASVT